MDNINFIDNPFISLNDRLKSLRNSLITRDTIIPIEKAISEIDLHLHTNYSNGYGTASGLVRQAYDKGIKIIAFTDHDGFAGIQEGFKAIQIVKELTGKDIHIVPANRINYKLFFWS